MYLFLRSNGHKLFLVLLALILGLSGFGSAVQPTIAQDTGLQDCTLLYAVQSGDTLQSIAQRFNTTQNRLLDINPLTIAERIFPGLVLCVSTQEDVILPPTGLQPGILVVDVDPGEDVTVQGTDFPGNARFIVQMFEFGIQNPQILRVTAFTTPRDGSFTRSFEIPEELQDVSPIRLRISSATTRLGASTIFRNREISRIQPIECAQFYTVQSGDTLSEIAQDFDISLQNLIELNNIMNRSLIFTGQRLCVEAADTILPPTGENATIDILDVDFGDDVTIRGRNFPTNVRVNAFISRTDGEDATQVASFISDDDGLFVRTLEIPEGLQDAQELLVRLQIPSINLTLDARFDHVQDGDEDERDGGLTLPDEPAARASGDLDVGERITLAQGNAGVFTPNSAYDATLVISRYNPEITEAENLTFAQRLLRVQVFGPDGNEIEDVRGLNYAFFEIDQETRELFDVNTLDIYRFDRQDNRWERCDIQVPINSENNNLQRLSCVIENFGVFGLAARR